MRRGLVWSLLAFVVVSVGALAATIGVGHAPLLGLDLRGGVSVVLRPQGTVDNSTLQQAVSIIERRVNGLGVSNSNVARQGQDVVINLPGIKDAQGALKTLGETATLYFRPVYCLIPAYAGRSPSATTTPTTRPATPTTPTTPKKALGPPATANLTAARLGAPSAATTATTTPSTTPSSLPLTSKPSTADCSATNAAQLPSTPVSQDTANATVRLPLYDNSVRYVLGPADMKGDVVSNTSVIAPTTGGGFEVQVNFTGKGAAQFDKIAAQRYPYYQQNTANPPPQSMEAIELDGVVESAPTIQAAAFHGTAVISGSSSAPFSAKQASDLALVLKYGSLPVRFTPQSVQTVSATIGRDSLRAGLLAGIGGIAVVLLYMILYYRALGLVVVLGLGLGGSLLYAILAQLSHSSSLTLTLAGVTGIIVSVGITVDSYVVYFERLKDEVRSGRSVRQSVERSFARAFRTVLTADLVSFLAALILYALTVGDVRGFAFTLGLSTLLDVITAFMFIRPIVILVGRRRAFTEARFLGVNRGLGVGAPAGEAT